MTPIVELANDVEVPPFLVAGWIADDVKPAPFVVLPMPFPLGDMSVFEIPSTLHQRIYKWPARVGPINTAGSSPKMTPTPKEIPQADSGLVLPSIVAWPRGDDQISPYPSYCAQPAVMVPLAELKGNGQKNVWTADHPTAPMWKPVVFGGYVDGSNVRFVISGVTRDGAEAALGGCTVYLMRSDKLAVNIDQYGNPIIGIKVSDASGNYEFQAGANVPHQLTAYLAGAPDVAGVTRADVVPTAT